VPRFVRGGLSPSAASNPDQPVTHVGHLGHDVMMTSSSSANVASPVEGRRSLLGAVRVRVRSG